MSTKYPGGLITKTPVTPAGPYETGAAPGVWTVEQALQYTKQGIWPTAGNVPAYIEDVFSTYLYAGNAGSQNIVNGVNLSTYGGMVWIKDRTQAASHYLQDTVRGANNYISTNNTNAEASLALNTVFNTNGFSQNNSFGGFNGTGDNYVSWTFREQPKFFDVVTFTSAASGNTTFSHNLGSTPGCVFIKNTQTADPWIVYHRSTGDSQWLYLNTTAAAASDPNIFSATSTTFTIKSTFTYASQSYVAYLFAHNAGGFGLTGTDNVISCGSFTTNASGVTSVTLGYEPQWVMIKPSSGQTGDWTITDNMRGFPVGGKDALLYPNTSGAEGALYQPLAPNATGFDVLDSAQLPGSVGYGTYIYIAIRRGPMKVPTVGTSVFALDTLGGTLPNPPGFNAGFPVDLGFFKFKSGTSDWSLADRLRGAQELYPNLTSAEAARATFTFDYQDGWFNSNTVSNVFQSYNFRRASSFFDVVCYTGTGAARTVTHNLTVAPEMMIVKDRTSSSYDWRVYSATLTATKYLKLNGDSGEATSSAVWNDTSPTASVFTVGSNATVNGNGDNYVAYLFATCAGVSKVGSYTGTGTTLQVNCGFTAGARFVLIKRTDSTGDWYVWDSARGIVAGNDPYLLLNSTAAEVTGTDYVDTYSSGFEITSTAPAAINANGGTFIFLAIA
jgi:hypothetical protein